MTNTRKLLVLVILCLFVTQLVACTSQTNAEKTADAALPEADSTVNQATQSTEEDISFAEMLPDHEKFFQSGSVTVIDADGGASYCISIKNITKDEYDDYVDSCQNGNFSNVTFQGKEMFQARTSDDKYYVSVQYWVESETDATQNSVNITCGNVRK